MELKLVSVTALVDTEVSFNRTFMELKLKVLPFPKFVLFSVLIGPSWN